MLRAGCAVVNVNPMYTPRELKHQLRDSGARAIIVAEPFLATVEAVLAEMPEILDCAVIGVDDEKWGEVGAAILLLKDGSGHVTPEDVISFVKSRLAAFKAPKHVRFVDDLPRTPSGKVQKHKLKADWKS